MELVALLSVFYKEGIVEYARSLVRLGWKIISSGGTAKALQAAGIPVQDISELTGFPAMLGHRVVTLHPKVEGGILARRIPEDEADLIKYGIPRISHVCVDPYPAPKAAADPYRTILEVLDLTDIGGPTMIRGAAKNFPHGISVVCDPADRPLVLSDLETYGHVREITRAKLAFKVFATMSSYDGAIAARLAEDYDLPFIHLSSLSGQPLRYGTNPHQERAWVFTKDSGLLSRGQWQIPFEGRPLSYTNWEEITCVVELLSRFDKDRPTAAVYKHESPCGVASHHVPISAFKRAWQADSVASFGGTVGVNFRVDEKIAEAMAANFLEGLVCPGLSPEALSVFKKKRKNLRVLTTRGVLGPQTGRWLEVKERMGLILVQERDFYLPQPGDFLQVSKKAATKRQIGELLFAAKCCQAMFSNATVITRRKAMIGYGRHGSSRVDTCQWAVDKAKQYGRKLAGSVAVTDGFFPFPDGLEALALAGVKVIACPSAPTAGQKSEEVIKAADHLGIAFYHLNHRLFRH